MFRVSPYRLMTSVPCVIELLPYVRCRKKRPVDGQMETKFGQQYQPTCSYSSQMKTGQHKSCRMQRAQNANATNLRTGDLERYGSCDVVAFLAKKDLNWAFDRFCLFMVNMSFLCQKPSLCSISVKLPSTSHPILNVYRSPDTYKHCQCQPLNIFLTEFYSLFTSFDTSLHPLVITGDFNIHVDDSSDNHALAFSKLVSHAILFDTSLFQPTFTDKIRLGPCHNFN